MRNARQMPNSTAPAMTERELQEHVRVLCADLGLYHYHTHDSRRSQGGFPDSWIISPKSGAVLYRELKAEHGTLSREQLRVGYMLRAGGHDYGIWRPSDLASRLIHRELCALAGAKMWEAS